MILMAVAVVRIAATFTVFSATSDESMHLSCGLELLTQHRYSLQLENPPLPRVIMATPPLLAGLTFNPDIDPWEQVRGLFYSQPNYIRNVAVGRIGNLLFFLIAAVAVWRWARRELGPAGGALATLLFTTQPIVLGYSGIANHDAPALAGVAVSLLAFARWLDQPTTGRAAVFGLAYGFAIACKFSCLPYIPLACLAMFAVARRRDWRSAAIAFPIAFVTMFLTVWASYAFVFGSLEDYELRIPPLGDGTAARVFAKLDPKANIPMPHVVAGVAGLIRLDREGHLSYLLGELSMTGFRSYFPIGIAVKTTLASLLLVICGFFFARTRAFLIPFAAALGLLLAGIPSTLDLGVRYVLPLYAPLMIAAATATAAMLAHPRRWVRIAAIVLLVWHTGASLLAHPDYFPYFNELAGRDPSRILVDSNLDWGQDALRLREVLREEKIQHVGLYIIGLHQYDKLGFPPHTQVEQNFPMQGWIAVSDHAYRVLLPQGGFQWLRGRPYRRVGKSIRLYYIP